MMNEQFVRAVMRDREREIRHRIRQPRPQGQHPSRSVRRVVGRSMIEIGHRIAAEPKPRLARSR